MKKIYLVVCLLILSLGLQAQVIPDFFRYRLPLTGNNSSSAVDVNLKVLYTLYLPTGTPSLHGGKDSSGAINFNPADTSVNVYIKGGVWAKFKANGSVTAATIALLQQAVAANTKAIKGKVDSLILYGKTLPTYLTINNASALYTPLTVFNNTISTVNTSINSKSDTGAVAAALRAKANLLIGINKTGGRVSDLTSTDSIYNALYVLQNKINYNNLNIGYFTTANLVSIPPGVNLVRTTGYSVYGVGQAEYMYDATVNSSYVSNNPRSSFISYNGRGFRLASKYGISFYMFGAKGDNSTDDGAAMQAAITFTGNLWLGIKNGTPDPFYPRGTVISTGTGIFVTSTTLALMDDVTIYGPSLNDLIQTGTMIRYTGAAGTALFSVPVVNNAGVLNRTNIFNIIFNGPVASKCLFMSPSSTQTQLYYCKFMGCSVSYFDKWQMGFVGGSMRDDNFESMPYGNLKMAGSDATIGPLFTNGKAVIGASLTGRSGHINTIEFQGLNNSRLYGIYSTGGETVYNPDKTVYDNIHPCPFYIANSLDDDIYGLWADLSDGPGIQIWASRNLRFFGGHTNVTDINPMTTDPSGNPVSNRYNSNIVIVQSLNILFDGMYFKNIKNPYTPTNTGGNYSYEVQSMLAGAPGNITFKDCQLGNDSNKVQQWSELSPDATPAYTLIYNNGISQQTQVTNRELFVTTGNQVYGSYTAINTQANNTTATVYEQLPYAVHGMERHRINTSTGGYTLNARTTTNPVTGKLDSLSNGAITITATGKGSTLDLYCIEDGKWLIKSGAIASVTAPGNSAISATTTSGAVTLKSTQIGAGSDANPNLKLGATIPGSISTGTGILSAVSATRTDSANVDFEVYRPATAPAAVTINALTATPRVTIWRPTGNGTNTAAWSILGGANGITRQLGFAYSEPTALNGTLTQAYTMITVPQGLFYLGGSVTPLAYVHAAPSTTNYASLLLTNSTSRPNTQTPNSFGVLNNIPWYSNGTNYMNWMFNDDAVVPSLGSVPYGSGPVSHKELPPNTTTTPTVLTQTGTGSAGAAPQWTSTTGTGNIVAANSPALSGTPTTPTAASGDNTTQVASDAFVTSAVAALQASTTNTYVPKTTTVDGFPLSTNITLSSLSNGAGLTYLVGSAFNGSAASTIGVDQTYNFTWSGSSSHTGTETFTTIVQPTGSTHTDYNTTDQTTNYEKATFGWASNAFTIATLQGGTGSQRSIKLSAAGGRVLTVSSSPPFLTFASGSGTPGSWFDLSYSSFNGSSGFQNGININPSVSQTSTAGYKMLLIDPWFNTVGSGTGYLFDFGYNSATNSTGTHTSIFTGDRLGNLVLTIGGITIPNAGSNATGKLVVNQTDLANAIANAVDNNKTVTANYTISSTDFAVGKKTTLDLYVDATNGAVTITLPSASSFTGYTIYVTKKDASTNAVTITPIAGPSNGLASQYSAKQFNTDGTNWYNH